MDDIFNFQPTDYCAACYHGNTLVKKFTGTFEQVETDAKRWLSQNVNEFAYRFKLDPTSLTSKDHPYSYQLI